MLFNDVHAVNPDLNYYVMLQQGVNAEKPVGQWELTRLELLDLIQTARAAFQNGWVNPAHTLHHAAAFFIIGTRQYLGLKVEHTWAPVFKVLGVADNATNQQIARNLILRLSSQPGVALELRQAADGGYLFLSTLREHTGVLQGVILNTGLHHVIRAALEAGHGQDPNYWLGRLSDVNAQLRHELANELAAHIKCEAERRARFVNEQQQVREALRYWRSLAGTRHLTPTVDMLRQLVPTLKDVTNTTMTQILRPHILGVKLQPALYGAFSWYAVEQKGELKFKLYCPEWLPVDAFPVSPDQREVSVRGPAKPGGMGSLELAKYKYTNQGGPVPGEGAWRKVVDTSDMAWETARLITGRTEGQPRWTLDVPLPQDTIAWMESLNDANVRTRGLIGGYEGLGDAWVPVASRPAGEAVCMVGMDVRVSVGGVVHNARECAYFLRVPANSVLAILNDKDEVLTTVTNAQPLSDPKVCEVAGTLLGTTAYIGHRKVPVVRAGEGELIATACGRHVSLQLFVCSMDNKELTWAACGTPLQLVKGRVSIHKLPPGYYAVTDGQSPEDTSTRLLVVPSCVDLRWVDDQVIADAGFSAHWTRRDDTDNNDVEFDRVVHQTWSMKVPEGGLATRWTAHIEDKDVAQGQHVALRFRVAGCSPSVRLMGGNVPAIIGPDNLRNDLKASFTGPRGVSISVKAECTKGKLKLAERLIDADGSARDIELQAVVAAAARVQNSAFDIVFYVGEQAVARTKYIPWYQPFKPRPNAEDDLKTLLNKGGPIAVTGRLGSGRRWLVEYVLGSFEKRWTRLPEFVRAPGRGIDYLLGLVALFGFEKGNEVLLNRLSKPEHQLSDATLALAIQVLEKIPESLWIMDLSHGEPCERLSKFVQLLGQSRVRVVVIGTDINAWPKDRHVNLNPFKVDGVADGQVNEKLQPSLLALRALARPYDEDEGLIDVNLLHQLAACHAVEQLPGGERRWRARKTDVSSQALEALKKVLDNSRKGPSHLVLEKGRVALMLGDAEALLPISLDDAHIAYADAKRALCKWRLADAETRLQGGLKRWPDNGTLNALLWCCHRLAGKNREAKSFEGSLNGVPDCPDLALMMAMMVRPAQSRLVPQLQSRIRNAALPQLQPHMLCEALAYAACIVNDAPDVFGQLLDKYTWAIQHTDEIPTPTEPRPLSKLRVQFMNALDKSKNQYQNIIQRRLVVLRLMDAWWPKLGMTENETNSLREWVAIENNPDVRQRMRKLLTARLGVN